MMTEKPEPKIKIINIDLHGKRYNMETKIAKTILRDFIKFKEDNELLNCSLEQSKPINNTIEVTWKFEKTYQNVNFNFEKIEQDFEKFAEFNNEDFCQLTKVRYNDFHVFVEYSIHKIYKLNFSFLNEKEVED